MAYGLEIRNNSNVTVLDESTRVGQLVQFGDVAVGANSSVTITGATGVTTSNSNEFAILIKSYMTTGTGGNFGATVTRGTNQYTLNNTTNVSGMRIAHFCVRF